MPSKRSGTCRRVSKPFWYRCPTCERKFRGDTPRRAAQQLAAHCAGRQHGMDELFAISHTDCYSGFIKFLVEIGPGDALTQHCILAALGGGQ